MSDIEKLFFAQLSTVILVFILALVDFEWLYVKMEETWIFSIRVIETIKLKIWANTHGIKRYKK